MACVAPCRSAAAIRPSATSSGRSACQSKRFSAFRQTRERLKRPPRSDVTLDESVGVDEPGADAVLGDDDQAVIPAAGT